MFLRRTAFSLHPQIRGSGVTIGITIAHTTYNVVEERKTLISHKFSCTSSRKNTQVHRVLKRAL